MSGNAKSRAAFPTHAIILPGHGNAGPGTRKVVPGAMEMAGKKHGRLPKRTTGGDCKSSGTAYGGSNPSPPTRAVGQLAARLAHIQEVTGSSPVCATGRCRTAGEGLPHILSLSGGKADVAAFKPRPARASGFVSRGRRLPSWWNGRHAGLRCRCPRGRPGSSPGEGTEPFAGRPLRGTQGRRLMPG